MKLPERLTVLRNAICPEDIFGTDPYDVADQFRIWSKLVHPDLHGGHRDAEEAFKILGELYVVADAKIESGVYGKRTALPKEVTIKSGKITYVLTDKLASGDLSELYVGYQSHLSVGLRYAVKVVRNPRNNDLMKNEADVLREIHDGPVGKLKVIQHVPLLVDTFELLDGKTRRVNILDYLAGFYTLRQVMDAYPDGLDPRDAAWMFNRLLAALLAGHQAGYVHGAVTPENFLVRPKDHGGVLVGWSHAVKVKTPLRAISGPREAYPKDALEKKPTDFGVDLHMAAGIFFNLVPIRVGRVGLPARLTGLMRACRLGKAHRSKDVYELHTDFAEVLKALYGPKKFRKFVMPTTADATTTT